MTKSRMNFPDPDIFAMHTGRARTGLPEVAAEVLDASVVPLAEGFAAGLVFGLVLFVEATLGPAGCGRRASATFPSSLVVVAIGPVVVVVVPSGMAVDTVVGVVSRAISNEKACKGERSLVDLLPVP